MSLCYYCMTDTVRNGYCTVCGRPRGIVKDDSLALPPGTHLGNGTITLGETLGAGGYGITYIAKDDQMNRVVCVKEFRPGNMVDGTRHGNALCPLADYEEAFDHALRSFIREAKILDALKAHPNIVNVYFYLKENCTAYYGMELLKGMTLKKWLQKRGKPLTAREACILLNPIMDALAFCHSYSVNEEDHTIYLSSDQPEQKNRGIIHRDVSPNNIFFCNLNAEGQPETVKLIDFGAAFASLDWFTQTYENVQCKGYSPVEQILYGKDAQGPWEDVYAFSATLYYCMTLQTLPASLQIYQGDAYIKSPSEIGVWVPKAVEDVLMAGLTLRYDERIQDMAEFQKRFCAACKVPEYHVQTPSSIPLPSDPVPPTARNAYLICIAGEKQGTCWGLGPQNLIGRDDRVSQIVIRDPKVSRLHCVIEDYQGSGRYALMDRQSSNGTYLWNQPLRPNQAVYLSDGDEFRIGDHVFKVKIE